MPDSSTQRTLRMRIGPLRWTTAWPAREWELDAAHASTGQALNDVLPVGHGTAEAAHR